MEASAKTAQNVEEVMLGSWCLCAVEKIPNFSSGHLKCRHLLRLLEQSTRRSKMVFSMYPMRYFLFLFQIINLPDYNKHFHMNISYVILGISQLKLGNRILNWKVIMFFSQMQSVCCKKKVVLGC
jgi:hypothetical protein